MFSYSSGGGPHASDIWATSSHGGHGQLRLSLPDDSFSRPIYSISWLAHQLVSYLFSEHRRAKENKTGETTPDWELSRFFFNKQGNLVISLVYGVTAS